MAAPSPVTLSMSLATALTLVHTGHGGFWSPPSFLSFGYCKNISVQPGLDFRKFSGRWFTVEKVPNEYDPDVACTNTDYSFYGEYLRSSQRGLLADRSKHKIHTVLTFDNETAGVMMVNSPGFPLAPLKILTSDYGTFACMYTCLDIVGFKAEFAFTLTRNPLPTEATLQTCRDVYTKEVELDPSSLVLVEQGKTCPYWSNFSGNVTAPLLRGENQVQATQSGAAIPYRDQREANSAISSSSSVPCRVVSLLLLVLATRLS